MAEPVIGQKISHYQIEAELGRGGMAVVYRAKDTRLDRTGGHQDGQFSPDGRWVAYASNESGKWEVYVVPFDDSGAGPGGKWQVSNGGGRQPRWRRDGKELFYLAPDNRLMSVEVKGGAAFEAGPPVPLFQTRPRDPISAEDRYSYDVAPDGQRFLINAEIEQKAAPMSIILNWTAELKQR